MVAAIAVLTSGTIVGCQQSSDEMTTVAMEEECQGATPEVRNAIYAAKLKNARARNPGGEWEENAQLITEAEEAVRSRARTACMNERFKMYVIVGYFKKVLILRYLPHRRQGRVR